MKGIAEGSISEYFRDYVNRCGDTERHTKNAYNGMNDINKMLDTLDFKDSDILIDKVADVALEYEYSGFLAGFQCAANMIKAILLATAKED